MFSQYSGISWASFSGRGRLITDLHLVPTSVLCRALPPLFICAIMALAQGSLTFIFTIEGNGKHMLLQKFRIVEQGLFLVHYNLLFMM